MRVPLSLAAEVLAAFYELRSIRGSKEDPSPLMEYFENSAVNSLLQLHRRPSSNEYDLSGDSKFMPLLGSCGRDVLEIYSAVKNSFMANMQKRGLFFDTLMANIFAIARRAKFKADFGSEFEKIMVPYLDRVIKLGRKVSAQVKEIDAIARATSNDCFSGYESKSELDSFDAIISKTLTESNEQLKTYRVIASETQDEIEVGLAMFQSERGLVLFNKIKAALERAGFNATFSSTGDLSLGYTLTPPRLGANEELFLAE